MNADSTQQQTDAQASEFKQRLEDCRKELAARNQSHVLHWWDDLQPGQQEQLLADLDTVPWSVVDELVESHVKQTPPVEVPSPLEPVDSLTKATLAQDDPELYGQAIEAGRELVAAGKVAAFVVAGGQGTRLGFDGPKGAVPVSPVKQKPLFQLFAEMLLAAGKQYNVTIPWYVMTSRTNHGATVEFFREHQYFGMQEEDVIFFSQGMLPTFDRQGNLMLVDKHQLALAPDGHGGSLKALYNSGALADMKRRGIECISYFQVDNPLIAPVDELFIGLHHLQQAEMSCKVSPKQDDLEKVGNICGSQGRVYVVEYSDFPEDLARKKNADGSRAFDQGNLAMHLINVEFVERIVGEGVDLPHHRAEKSTAALDADGVLQSPAPGEKNSVKLEKFVFDALPLAEKVMILQIERTEEFSPVKAASGVDSKETSIRDQIRRAANWLEAAGVEVPRDAADEPDALLEIAPSFANSAEQLREKMQQKPSIEPGASVYID